MTEIGRIFQQGGSQAVRIPKGMRFPEDVSEVRFERDAEGRLVLEPEMPNLGKSIQELKELWDQDPRAAFEKAVPEGGRLRPEEGINALLVAGVLPFKPAPNGLDDSNRTPPWQNARWSFWMADHGWLDAWMLLNLLKHEDYLVIALVGLGIPLDKIAFALALICGGSAWSGLGGVGWLWAFSRQPNVNKGGIAWAEQIPALVDLGLMASPTQKTGRT